MSEQTTDFRQLVAEYIAGQHRPTRHADICLDPQLADRIDTAHQAVEDAKSDVEVERNRDDDNPRRKISEASPVQKAESAVKDAEKALAGLVAQAKPVSIRLVFTALDSEAYHRMVGEISEQPEATRSGFEQTAIATATLSAVTTIDDKPTDISLEDGQKLIKRLPQGQLIRCYQAAMEACLDAPNLPF